MLAAICCPAASLAAETPPYAYGSGTWPTLKPDCGLSIIERDNNGYPWYYIVGLSLAEPPRTLQYVMDCFDCPPGTRVEIGSSIPADPATGQILAATNERVAVVSSTNDKRMLPIIVMGDVLNTGKMSLSQVIRMANAVSGVPLGGPELMAGDFGGTGKISLSDLVTEAKLFIDPSSVSIPNSPPGTTAPSKPEPTPSPSQGNVITENGVLEAAYLLRTCAWRMANADNGRQMHAAVVGSTIDALTDLWNIREEMRRGEWTHPCTLLEPSFPLSPEITHALDTAIVVNYQPAFTYEAVSSVVELFESKPGIPDQGSSQWNSMMYYLDVPDSYERIVYENGRFRCYEEWFGTPALEVIYKGPNPFTPTARTYGIEITYINTDTPIGHEYVILGVKTAPNAQLGFYLDGIDFEDAGSTWPPGYDGDGFVLPPLKPFPYDRL